MDGNQTAWPQFGVRGWVKEESGGRRKLGLARSLKNEEVIISESLKCFSPLVPKWKSVATVNRGGWWGEKKCPLYAGRLSMRFINKDKQD